MTIFNLKWPLFLAAALALVVSIMAPASAEQAEELTVMISQEPGPDPVPAAAPGETNPPFDRTEPMPGEGVVTQAHTTENVTCHGGGAAYRGGAIRPG